MKKKPVAKHPFLIFMRSAFWFIVGICLGLFFTISFVYIIFQKTYGKTVFPGVYVNGINVGGKTEKEVADYFDNQNQAIADNTFTFSYNGEIATISAQALGAGYNSKLLAHQAYLIGRSNYLLSDIVLVFSSYLNSISLPPSYTYSDATLHALLKPIQDGVATDPVDALFSFSNNRVTAFRPSSDGQELNIDEVKQSVLNTIPNLLIQKRPQTVTIPMTVRILKPKIETGAANTLGINELIGTGTSLFQHSIPSRIYNVNLAASRVNGVLVAPGEVFSFDKAVGDVSKLTGYQQAYVIENGKTVLGDGGGVCQVSTTLFRAILNAGLPIVERHAHAYRVGYYEEDSPPGIDATVFVPTVDLKFKNDTGNSILIQSVIDPDTLRLTFFLYGTKDNREVTMTTPVVTRQTPAPDPLYTDDPTLPAGTIKQIDFAANGAHVSFSRTVTKDNKVIIQDTFTSDYQPWRAVYLRGTKS